MAEQIATVPPAPWLGQDRGREFPAFRPSDRRVVLALRLMVLTVIALQRFAVPGMSTALCLPIVLAVLSYLVLEGAVVPYALRTKLYLLAVGACCAATLVSAAYFNIPWSLNSLALLLVLYLPFCLRLQPEFGRLFRPMLEFFNAVMLVAACVALAQWAAQMAGWVYHDLLDFVPQQLLIQTYNTSYPVQFGSSVMKSNAVVFLEPSFCSQYLAIALVVQLLLGRQRWRMLLYAAALLTTVSGTGLVLAVVGLSFLGARRGPAWAARILLLLLLLGVGIRVTPLGELLTTRLSEQREQNSSAQARFVAPYVLVAGGLTVDVPTVLVGRGPGVVSRPAAAELFNTQGVEANYPVIPKLAAEYGLIATMAFSAFMIVAIIRGTPSATVTVMMLFVYFVLSGSLLQPHTVLTAYVFTSLFAGGTGLGHNGPPLAAGTRKPATGLARRQASDASVGASG
jgi:hypothetical protein